MENEKKLSDEFQKRVRETVEEYIEGEEGYGDAALLEINPADLSVKIVEQEDDSLADDTEIGYCLIMDLVKMSIENPGQWIPDDEAIAGLAMEYC